MPEKPKTLDVLLKEGKLNDSITIDDKRIRNLVKRYNEEYVHWDELRRKNLPLDPEILWAHMKRSRESQSKHIEILDISLTYNITSQSQRIMHILDTGASGMIVFDESQKDSLRESEMKRYIISSLMEEAIASSQIEGAVTTTKEAKRMLRENRKPRSKSEQMIVNDYLTMQRIKEIKGQPLTKEMILELHGILTHNTLDEDGFEGRFREDDDTIVGDPFESGKEYHHPPNYDKIPKYIDSLCNFANQDSEPGFQHPLVKAILIHFIIGYVHPFVDGNGRLARALMYWFALKRNYWLFEYMAISKAIKQRKGKYGMAYLHAETDDNDVTYFINYNLNCMELALDNTKSYILSKKEEQQDAMKLVEIHPNLNFRQAELLKDLIKHKGELVSVSEIMSKFNVVNQTARTDLLLLVELGFLERKRFGNKMFFTYRRESNPQKEEKNINRNESKKRSNGRSD